MKILPRGDKHRTRLALIKILLVVAICQFIEHDWNILNYSVLSNKISHWFPKANPSIELNLSSRRVMDVDFRMIIITYNRPWSLHRLLLSLNTVDYMSDTVTVEIWIDRSKEGHIHEQTYAVGHKFVFEKGSKTVINQTRHVGLYGQWMGLWQPTEETKEIAVIFEDDLTVSPFFYRYLKKVHAKYGSVPHINSYALQCSMKHNGKEGNLHAPDSNPVFLYPILGTCGFSPQKRNWIEFREWYIQASKDPYFYPLVPGIKPTDWYNDHIRFKATENMWEMWHIYHAYKNKYYTLYPNLLRCEGMTINWKEQGLHFGAKVNVTDRLLSTWDSRLDHLPDKLIHLDVNGDIVGI